MGKFDEKTKNLHKEWKPQKGIEWIHLNYKIIYLKWKLTGHVYKQNT